MKVVPYSGIWTMGSETRTLRMLLDRSLDLEILVGRPRTVSRLAEDVRRMADLREDPTS